MAVPGSKKIAKEKRADDIQGHSRESRDRPATSSNHSNVLALQRIGGNQAVSQALQLGDEDGVPPIVHEVLRSGGQPLNPSTRAFMESRFGGYDFGQVRIHTDGKATESAQTLNAHAYTIGNDIVFGASKYLPQTRTGKMLLAHELAHVIQQSRGGPPPSLRSTAPHERSATMAASALLKGKTSICVTGSSGYGVARVVGKPESPEHGVAGGGEPPVPVPGKTPFNFIAETPGPALENWKKSVKGVLEREYGRSFASFQEANNYFKKHLDTLPSGSATKKGTRENFARRMRDRVRKRFWRAEAKSPSFSYTNVQKNNLKNGRAPSADFQIEHLIDITVNPKRSFDPENVGYTRGGPGGTAPKGTEHYKKTKQLRPRREPPRKAEESKQKRMGWTPGTRPTSETHPALKESRTRRTSFIPPRYKGAGLSTAAQFAPEVGNILQDKAIRHNVATQMLNQWNTLVKWRKEFPNDVILGVVSLYESMTGEPGMRARGVNYVRFYHGSDRASAEAEYKRDSLLSYVGENAIEIGPLYGWIEPSQSLDEAKEKIESETCFIATACYESALAPELHWLRGFRDIVLRRYRTGRIFIRIYYQTSRPLAAFLLKHVLLRVMVRNFALSPIVFILRRSAGLWRPSRGSIRHEETEQL